MTKHQIKLQKSLKPFALLLFSVLTLILLSAGFIVYKNKQTTAPKPDLHSKTSNSSQDVSFLLQKAIKEFNAGEFDKALADYESAYKKEPHNPEVLIGYATELRFLGKYDEAEKLFLVALENDPESDTLRIDIGKLYRNTGEHQKALKMFEEAKKINPNNSNLYSYGLAYLYRDMGRIEEAVESAEKAYELDPNSDFNLMALGDMYRDAGRPEESEKWFKKAIEKNPKNEAYLGLGFLYLQEEKYEDAKQTFNAYLENIKPK